MIQPIITFGLGRTGSTLVMELLGTAPRIAFDRGYPHEVRLVTGLVANSLLFAAADPQMTPYVTAPLPPVLVVPERLASIRTDHCRLLHDPPGGRYFWRGHLRTNWGLFVGYLREKNVNYRYYAEKGCKLVWKTLRVAGIPFKPILRIRDPRDIWCSTVAFDKQRGFYGFGRKPGQSEREYLFAFIASIREVYGDREIVESDCFRLSYEQFVTDPLTVTDRLSQYLELDLDYPRAEANTRLYSSHKTKRSPEASIGRWRTDLPDDQLAILNRELQDILQSLGYH
jgi:hypothetical protein